MGVDWKGSTTIRVSWGKGSGCFVTLLSITFLHHAFLFSPNELAVALLTSGSGNPCGP